MNLIFQLVQQTPVEDSGILLLGRNDDGVEFFAVRQLVVTMCSDDIVRDSFLENFPEFLTLLGIRPQNEDGMRPSRLADLFWWLRPIGLAFAAAHEKLAARL